MVTETPFGRGTEPHLTSLGGLLMGMKCYEPLTNFTKKIQVPKMEVPAETYLSLNWGGGCGFSRIHKPYTTYIGPYQVGHPAPIVINGCPNIATIMAVNAWVTDSDNML